MLVENTSCSSSVCTILISKRAESVEKFSDADFTVNSLERETAAATGKAYILKISALPCPTPPCRECIGAPSWTAGAPSAERCADASWEKSSANATSANRMDIFFLDMGFTFLGKKEIAAFKACHEKEP